MTVLDFTTRAAPRRERLGTPRHDDDPVHREAQALDVLPPPRRLSEVHARPLAYAITPLALRRDITAVVGETGSMKTTVLVHLLAAVTVGAPVFGALPVTAPGPVLFLSGEDEGAVLRNRVEAMCAGQGWDTGAVLSRFHLWDEGLALDDPRWKRRILDAARDLGVHFIAGDPLRDIAGPSIEENSNSDAAKVNAVLRAIVTEADATFVYAGHVSKPSEGKQKVHRFRGASAWLNATRLAWWAEHEVGGFTLTPLKGNRSGQLQPLRVKATITSPDGLNWQAAHFALDTAGDVTGADVVRVLRLVASAASPPPTRAIRALLKGEGVGTDRADAAQAECRARGWVEWTAGPRGSHLWTLTEAGRARLLLAGGDRA